MWSKKEMSCFSGSMYNLRFFCFPQRSCKCTVLIPGATEFWCMLLVLVLTVVLCLPLLCLPLHLMLVQLCRPSAAEFLMQPVIGLYN